MTKHDPNPRSRYYGAHYEEVLAVAMLLGDLKPVICSCCIGAGEYASFFGGSSTCSQCKGCGYDMIGADTARYFREKVKI